MASGCGAGAYSGRPQFTLTLCIATAQNDVANNRSYYNWSLVASGPAGQTWSGDAGNWNVNINGQGWSGSRALDFRNTSSITIATGTTNWIGHDAAGNAGINGAANHLYAGLFGSASAVTNFYADQIPQPPGAPTVTDIINLSPTNFAVVFALGPNNGSAIDAVVATWFADAALTQLVWQDISGPGNPGDYRYTEPATRGGPALTPGQTYWVRIQMRNAAGYGPGTVVSQTTPVASAPGIEITPSLDGTQATVALSPPSGASSVTSYRVERRDPDGTITQYDTATTPLVVTGLTPGVTYGWRASAFFGSYQSPWSEWQSVRQPNPNVTPGDYFDGDTPPADGLTYVWDGTPGLSTSRATAGAVVGWMSFEDGAIVSGGVGAVVQTADPYDQDFAAKVIFATPPTDAGFEFGQAQQAPFWSEAQEGGQFTGSMFVKVSAAQRLAPVVTFFDGLGTVLDATEGAGVVVPAATWTRLSVTAVAPPATVFATVTARDVAGDGWRLWTQDDVLVADAAMINVGMLYPYFNGNTPDTTQFDYLWLGDENASVSERVTMGGDTGDPLEDPDCPTPPAAPQAPSIDDPCITEVATWRRFWAVIPPEQVALWVDQIPTITITTGALEVRQVRIRYYQNPDDLDPIDFVGPWEAEQILSYIPPNTSITIDGVAQRTWATLADGTVVAADRLLFGSGGRPASWPVLACGVGWLISLDVPLDLPEGAIDVTVGLTGRYN